MTSPVRIALIALLVASAARAAEANADAAEAWHTLSIGSYEDATDQFARLGGSREAELGRAIGLINRPPVTPSSLADARDRFTRLADGHDTIAHAARYFLGRLRQLDPSQPDVVGAAREFEALVGTGADDSWCRLALIKLAILRLAALPGPADPAPRCAEAEPLLELTADPTTRRDLHLVIAEARLSRLLYDTATLAHLRAALAATASTDALRVDLLIQIGRLATKLGDKTTARRHFQLFLHDYPKERRTYTVEAALAALDGRPPP